MCLTRMSISFNRNRTQREYEAILGIAPSELKEKKELFKSHTLTKTEADLLKTSIKEDALDFFYNAALSFAEGIDSIYQRRYSWATVKLYYSVFYSLRASMASKNIAILVNQGILRLKLKEAETPYGTNNKKYKSTHKGTINHYTDLYSGSDILLTNTIDGLNTYQWLEELRDITNYREVCFVDPQCINPWSIFDEALSSGKLTELLTRLQEDDHYIFCFQEDYAAVAIPIKRLQQTVKDLVTCGLMTKFNSERKEHLENIIKGEERNIKMWEEICD